MHVMLDHARQYEAIAGLEGFRSMANIWLVLHAVSPCCGDARQDVPGD